MADGSSGNHMEKGTRFTSASKMPADHKDQIGAHSMPTPDSTQTQFDEKNWLAGFSTPQEPITSQTPVNSTKEPGKNSEGFMTYTLKPGILLRIRGPIVPETDSDEPPLDIPAPEGMLVRSHKEDKGRIIKGERPENDTMWRYFGTVRTPDDRIRGGWRAFKRDKKGQFSIPVVHPEYKEDKPPHQEDGLTLDLK